MRNIFLAALLLLSVTVMAQAGSLDPTFGDGGILRTHIGDKDYSNAGKPHKIFVQPDGKLLIVIEMNNRLSLTRHLADGTIDTTFANKGYSNGFSFYTPYSAAMQPDGKVLLSGPAGYASSGQKVDFKVIRLNNDGSLDSSFGESGIVMSDFDYNINVPYAIATRPNGKIVVAGTAANDITKDGVFAITCFNADGHLDTTFGVQGKQITHFEFQAHGKAMTLDSGGKIILAGNGYQNGTDTVIAIIRYDEHGMPDTTFGKYGKVVTSLEETKSVVNAVAIDGDNNIVVSAIKSAGFYNTMLTLLRYKPDGSLDQSFNSTGVVHSVLGINPYWPQAMAVQKDNKIVVSGSILDAKNLFTYVVSRFDANGHPDSNFNGTGENTTQFEGYSEKYVSALTLQPDGKLVAGGFVAIYGPYTQFALALTRYDTDGILDEDFGSGGKTTSSFHSSLIYQYELFTTPEAKLLVTGWGYVDSSYRTFLAKYNHDGSTDTTFASKGILLPKENHYVSFFTQADGKILASGYYSDLSAYGVARFLQNGTPDSSYGQNGIIITLPFEGNSIGRGPEFLQSNDKLITSTSVLRDAPYSSTYTISRYNTDGTIDASFGHNGKITTDTSNYVIYKQKNDKLWVRSGPIDYHSDSMLIVRYTADGIIDSSFGQNAKTVFHFIISTMSEQQDGSFIILGRAGLGPNATQALYRVKGNGLLDSTFGKNGKVLTSAIWLAVQQNDKIITGESILDVFRNSKIKLTRYMSDGSIDSTFGRNGLVITDIDPNSFDGTNKGVINQDRLYVTGSISNIETSGFIAAYTLDEKAIVLKCTSDTVVATSKGKCTAEVYNIGPKTVSPNSLVSYKLTGATQGQGTGTASGKTFNKGITYVTYALQSDTSQSCTFAVKVNDTEAPVLSNVTLSKVIVWPSNHNLQDVTVNYNALDNCGIANIKLSVRDNETGTNLFDWQLIDAHHIRLPAEDLCSLAGKTFTITATATDLSANTTSKSITLTIPEHLPGCNSEAEEQKLQVSAHPNPTRNFFLVHIKSRNRAQPVIVRITSSTGNVLETRQVTANNQLQFGSHYRPGIYYIEAEQAGVKTTAKLVKLP
jgi:uncharacterized delta-60 repeat protein